MVQVDRLRPAHLPGHGRLLQAQLRREAHHRERVEFLEENKRRRACRYTDQLLIEIDKCGVIDHSDS